MSVILVASVCVINIILWIIFFSKFKKLFSTDDIIRTTREELDRMITDVNRNTERDITLIQDKISELKKLIADADRRITVAANEQKKLAMGNTYKHSIDAVTTESRKLHKSSGKTQIQKAAERYQSIKPDNSYTLTTEGFKHITAGQQELFTEKKEKTEKESAVTKDDGTTYQPVPVVVPKVYMSENPIVRKKSFSRQVQELYNKGETIEEIASKFSKSTTEIQLAIDLNSEL